jgi:subtilisin family serine protease
MTLALLWAVPGAWAADRYQAPELARQSGYLIELQTPPTADGTAEREVRGEQAAFRAAARDAGVRLREQMSFKTLFNGISVDAETMEVAALARLQGVKAIHPVQGIEMVPGAGTDIANAVAMTGADIAQSRLGYTGRGVKVGIIDTGIDYDHPDLGGCFGPGCRVEAGYDFVGDDFDGYNAPRPDADPDDACEGHGTHVAGIVGANGKLKGVAPDVTFGAYRVFGCPQGGETRADLVIAAMERALADGMDVVNTSFGASAAGAWPTHPFAQAADRLVKQGVVVAASAGNFSVFGGYASGAPAIGDRVIGVASVDNTQAPAGALRVSGHDALVWYQSATRTTPLPPTSGYAPLVRTGTVESAADACAPLEPGSLTGAVALIRRGTCILEDKARHAEEAGAVAAVIYSDGEDIFIPHPAVGIPVLVISREDGEALDDVLARGPATLTWTDAEGRVPVQNGGRLSDFSSYGPRPDLVLKPDIAAPGGLIMSTLPLELGSYRSLGGTSMAAPHVAGAVALLLEARPHTPATAVRDILLNSADPVLAAAGGGALDHTHRQGAGMLDIDDAIQATTRVTPAKLSLGESEHGSATRTLTIANAAGRAAEYELSAVQALATGPDTFLPSPIAASSAVSFESSRVRVPAGGTATVRVTISADPLLPERSVYGGWVVLTPVAGGAPLRVPFTGLKGDYQTVRVLEPRPWEFPWLARLIGNEFWRQPGGARFSMQAADIPFLLLHYAHQSRRVRVTISDAATGAVVGRAWQEEYARRNLRWDHAWWIPLDGWVTRDGRRWRPLADGAYRATLSILKALGDESDPAHTETWTSPAFVIDRG